MSSLEMEVGRKIREARRRLGLSQREMAVQLSWQQPKLSKIERGATTLTFKDLTEIADILGQPVSSLLPLDDPHSLTSLEHKLLNLFRRLDSDVQRLLVFDFILEMLDQKQEVIDALALQEPDFRSSISRKLMRWLQSVKNID